MFVFFLDISKCRAPRVYIVLIRLLSVLLRGWGASWAHGANGAKSQDARARMFSLVPARTVRATKGERASCSWLRP